MAANSYYGDNIEDSFNNPEKTTVKQFYPNKNPHYSPQGQNGELEMYPINTSKGNGMNELGSSVERQSLIDVRKEKEKEALNIPVSEKEPIIKDKFFFCYIIFLIHGVGTLMPWNMFITANSYFVDYKLATNASSGADYRDNFLSYLGICSQVPNVILNAINLFGQCGNKGGSTSVRIIVSIIIVIVCFILTVILAVLDSSEWPGTFFGITIGSVIIINMANGIYQNSIYGLAASLPMKYTNAVVLGSNISGTLTSLISILSIASTPDPRTSAIYYFVTAIFVLLVAFDTYFLLPLLPFYRHHKRKHKSEHTSFEDNTPPKRNYWKIFKQVYPQLLGVFCVFFVTLTCFPAIQVNVEMIDSNFPIPAKYFTPVTCFLFFNAFAMLGNLTTEFIRKPGPRWVWIPILLRVLFIPFFLLCNYHIAGRRLASVPVLFGNDWVYIIGAILMAFTSGYFSSLCMMYAPSLAEPKDAPTAGMMAAFFLILGIFAGVSFSRVMALIVQCPGELFDAGQCLVAEEMMF